MYNCTKIHKGYETDCKLVLISGNLAKIIAIYHYLSIIEPIRNHETKATAVILVVIARARFNIKMLF